MADETGMTENPYGIEALWTQSDYVGKGVFVILIVIASDTTGFLAGRVLGGLVLGGPCSGPCGTRRDLRLISSPAGRQA